MSKSEATWRSLHDVGLAAWFGGSLFGAVALGRGSASTPDARRARADAWRRWTPVVGVAATAHLAGGAGLVAWNKGRIAAQKGVPTSTAVKTALTAAALACTAASVADGRRLARAEETGTVPVDEEQASRTRMDAVRWALPALLGGIVVMGAVHGEQQRPREMARGVAARVGGVLGGALAGRSGRKGDGVGEAIGDALGTVGDVLGDALESVGDTLGGVGHAVLERLPRAA